MLKYKMRPPMLALEHIWATGRVDLTLNLLNRIRGAGAPLRRLAPS